MKLKNWRADLKSTVLLTTVALVICVMAVIVIAASSDVHETTLSIAGVSPDDITIMADVGAQDPTTCANTTVGFWFVANDSDGEANLNDSSAQVRFTNDSDVRSNTTCTVVNLDPNANNYTCDVQMTWYDTAGLWLINASICDIDDNCVENSTESFTYNSGIHTEINVSSISFGTGLSWSTNDIAATNDPQGVRNCGNINLTEINVTAIDLVHTSYPQDYINASQCEVDGDDVADNDVAMDNNTNTNIDQPSVLYVEPGPANYTDLYYHIDLGASAGRHSGTYDTTTWGNWTVGVGQ